MPMSGSGKCLWKLGKVVMSLMALDKGSDIDKISGTSRLT